MKTYNPFKLIFRYYAWLFRKYDTYGMTGAYRVVRKQSDGSFATAGWKAQVIGNTYVQAILIGVLYMGYRIGKDKGHEEAQIEQLNRDLDVPDLASHFDGTKAHPTPGWTMPDLP